MTLGDLRLVARLLRWKRCKFVSGVLTFLKDRRAKAPDKRDGASAAVTKRTKPTAITDTRAFVLSALLDFMIIPLID